MLLNAGTETLITAVRRWANDPSTAANPRFDTAADITPSINVEYLFLRDLLRLPDNGYAKKVTYLDGQAATTPEDVYYPLPDDYVGRLRVEISTSGANLSTTLPGSQANVKVLTPAGYDRALDHYYVDSGGTSDIKYVFMMDREFGISTPLTSTEAGTKSIRLTYEASTDELQSDNDEPQIPRPYHDVIAMGAAIRLLIGHDLPIGDLERRYEFKKAAMQRSAWNRMADYTSQIVVANRTPSTRRSNVGKVRRRG